MEQRIRDHVSNELLQPILQFGADGCSTTLYQEFYCDTTCMLEKKQDNNSY